MSGTSNRPPRAVLKNVEAVVRLEERQLRHRSTADRIADAIADFSGTLSFVLLHLAWFALWAVVNIQIFPGVKPFDPYPFELLTMIVSMEGVLLATFVLIKQNRMGRISEQRDHLDLQINLLAEKETTKVIQMLTRISEQLGIEHAVVDPETEELGQVTAVENVAEQVQSKLEHES
jgi:uncharacterized membrane protein